jgi:uncharacterized membrane protein YGL010W
MSQTTQRQVDMLVSKYAGSHRNSNNEIIQCICVPAIAFSLLGFI